HRPATPSLSTLSLHDALPISTKGSRHQVAREEGARRSGGCRPGNWPARYTGRVNRPSLFFKSPARTAPPEPSTLGRLRNSAVGGDRKSTRLNSSHQISSYAVF